MADKIITMEIDGHTVQLPDGMNLVDAARMVGVDIPNLCHLEHMRGVGACRMCMVEVEGSRGPNTACTMKTKEGLKIKTDSSQIKDLRKMVIDLILSMHPLDCMTCPKAGVCWLQDLAYRLDVRESNYTRKNFGHAIDDANGFIERDPNYCILCGKCVRVCTAQNTNILEFMGRGVGAKVTTAQDKPLHETDCTFCGSCLDACPVNAILESGRRPKGREWQLEKSETTCTLCGSGCSLVVSEGADGVVKVTSPKPNAFICAVGRFGFDALNADTRVMTPKIRKNGALEDASWEDAMEAVAAKLKAAKANPAKVGIIANASVTNEDAYMLQKLGRAAVGTNNVDTTASLSDTATIPAFLKAFGGIPEAENCLCDADLIMTIGVNACQWSRALPAHDAKIRKTVSGGAKLIVLDPADSAYAGIAAKNLKVAEGTDTYALAAIMSVLVKENMIAEGRSLKANGLDAVKADASAADAAKLADAAGLSLDDVKEAADLIAKAKLPMILYSTGVTGKDNGADVVLSALNLAALAGGQVIPVLLDANAVGAAMMGLSTATLPGFAAAPAGGMNTAQMLKGGLDFLYTVGDVPAGGKPASFVVAQVSHMNGIAEQADVVLPAPAFIEQDGSIINYYGAERTLWSVMASEAEYFSPWEVAAELSERIGGGEKAEDIEDVMEEMSKFSMPCDEPVLNASVVKPSKGAGSAAIKSAGSMMALNGSVIGASRVAKLMKECVKA